MRERPELQDALSDKMKEIASGFCSVRSLAGTEGNFFDTVDDTVFLDQLDSMLLTLHGSEGLEIEDSFKVENKGTACCKVIFEDVKFTWIDTGDLHNKSTRLRSGKVVPDNFFAEIERKWLRFIPTSGPYPIRISWMGDSAWAVDATSSTGTAKYLWGWPHPASETMDDGPGGRF